MSLQKLSRAVEDRTLGGASLIYRVARSQSQLDGMEKQQDWLTKYLLQNLAPSIIFSPFLYSDQKILLHLLIGKMGDHLMFEIALFVAEVQWRNVKETSLIFSRLASQASASLPPVQPTLLHSESKGLAVVWWEDQGTSVEFPLCHFQAGQVIKSI